MFEEKTTLAERMIELRDKKNQEEVLDINNDIFQEVFVIDQKIYEIEESTIADNRIKMYMPTDFGLLDEDLAESKFPNYMRPQYIYSDKTTEITMTFTFDEKDIEAEKLGELKESMINLLSDLHPEYEILEEETLQTEETEIELFGFAKSVIDGELFQVIFFMSWKGKLLLGGFSCSMDIKDEWYDILCQMLQTIRIADHEMGEDDVI